MFGNYLKYWKRSVVQKIDRVKIDLTPVIMIVQAFGHFDVFLVLKPSIWTRKAQK